MIFNPASHPQSEDVNGRSQHKPTLATQHNNEFVDGAHAKRYPPKSDWSRRWKKMCIMARAVSDRRILIPYGGPQGTSDALPQEIDRASTTVDELLDFISDPLLSCDYYNYILPSLKRLNKLEVQQEAIERQISRIASSQTAAHRLKQTLVTHVLSQVFKSHPLVLAQLLTAQEKYKNFSAESMVALLHKATVQLGASITRDREPGERFFDRVLIAFLASWVAFGMQPIFSEKLSRIFDNSPILEAVALVLAYGTGWSFYEVARRSIIEHFVNLDPAKPHHWKETIWILTPVLVEVFFVLSWSIQFQPYNPNANPIFLWISMIIGSAFGASTLTYWARSLAPKVRKHREEFDRAKARAQENESKEDKAADAQMRDKTLDEALPGLRKASTQASSLTTTLKIHMKKFRNLNDLRKFELKSHAAIVSDWRKRIRFKLLDLEYRNLG